jgi:dolichyl-diphosphooligosaccharide--protein glycosyltransferase
MVSNAKLFSVGDFDFRLQHLLIIGILALSVSTSALLRAQPAEYGFALHEFDPFFNYRATEFIVDNGYSAYLEWHDDKSWHPHGRDVSGTSQVMLHLSTATLYNIFGGNSSLYDFTIMFPLIIGSLTCVVVFALVRVIGGTTAGLIASLMFAISLPILLRGSIGWFKSEPFGLFLSFIAIYLFLSAIKSNKGKISFTKLIFGGIFFGLSLAAWGGNQFFLIPLAIFFIALPFFNNDRKFLFWAIPTFAISLLLTSLCFERPGIGFVTSYGGFLVILPTIFMILLLITQTFSNQTTRIRNSIFVLIGFVVSGIGIISAFNILPSFRYQNALNPFLSAQNALVTSVSEHMSTDLETSFAFSSVFIIFGLIGAWLIFSNRSRNSKLSIPNHLKAFTLICGLTGIYTSSAFVRLELFGNIALIILGAIGLTILLQHILEKQNLIIKFIFCAVIIGLMITPMIVPEKSNWTVMGKQIPVIFNGATFFKTTTDDWADATHWIKNNTPTDAVIFSWWDYGYWIQTLGERTTLADNSTLNTTQIEKIARTFLSTVDDAWVILDSSAATDVSEHYVVIPKVDPWEQHLSPAEYLATKKINSVTGLDADYILIFIAGIRYETDQGIPLYDLHGGADETKRGWITSIAGLSNSRFVESDGFTPNQNFQQNTLFGNLIPYSIVSYFDPTTMEQHSSFRNGLTALYVKDIKFQDPDGPFMLVYASPSFSNNDQGVLQTVLIYKVNHDFMG